MRKDLVEKIKRQLKSLFTQKFAQVKAGDMIISTPDDFISVGSEVYMIDEQGLNIPLPDGEYILDSGEKCEVLSGKVVEISAPEMEEMPTEEGEVIVEEKIEEKMQEMPCSCVEKVEKMEVELAELKKMVTQMTSEKEIMKEEFKKFASSPSTQSITVKPSEFKSVEDKKTASSNLDLGSIFERAKKKVRNN
jgi:hypothetical protein